MWNDIYVPKSTIFSKYLDSFIYEYTKACIIAHCCEANGTDMHEENNFNAYQF